jgi:hypothetical protein
MPRLAIAHTESYVSLMSVVLPPCASATAKQQSTASNSAAAAWLAAAESLTLQAPLFPPCHPYTIRRCTCQLTSTHTHPFVAAVNTAAPCCRRRRKRRRSSMSALRRIWIWMMLEGQQQGETRKVCEGCKGVTDRQQGETRKVCEGCKGVTDRQQAATV